ncbi:MAG: biotin--[acetyl-CoA-carboxylase] ligase [bacterium]
MEIITFDELDSTNDYLKEFHDKYENFTTIRAIKQKKGRGRFERVWTSKKDLTFSILFKESFPHHFIAPLTINTVLNNSGFNSVIKWPNDILIDGVKTCGILIEKIFSGKKSVDIVGIGINVEKRSDFNYLHKYKKIKPANLLKTIVKLYSFFCTLPVDELRDLYITKSTIINKEVEYKNEQYKVVNINLNGELVISNEKEEKIVNAYEIDCTTMIIKK